MKLMLATDGSKCAENAARLLARLPHATTLELTIISVNYLPGFHRTVESVEWARLGGVEFTRNKAAEACRRVEAMFEGANARIETVVSDGHPGITIVEEAKARNIELVVLGALGHTFFERVFLGSVSDFVATHATCSVLVVRPGNNEAADEKLDICVAYDDSDSCKRALVGLGDLQWQRNVKLDLVSVIAGPYIYAEVPIEIDNEAHKQTAMAELEQAATELRKHSRMVQCHVIESSHIGSGIIAAAEEFGNNMIVMGDTGRGLMGRFFLGSVSRYVLQHAKCSVAIVRRGDR